jgi:hypothetical protein
MPLGYEAMEDTAPRLENLRLATEHGVFTFRGALNEGANSRALNYRVVPPQFTYTIGN